MASTGFEPATPGLRVQYSDRAELRGLVALIKETFKNVLLRDVRTASVL